MDVTISGATLTHGTNRYDIATWGPGGALESDASDGGQLTLSNDVITDNSTTDGEGGGVTPFNDARNNSTPNAITSNRSKVTITNTTITLVALEGSSREYREWGRDVCERGDDPH